MYIISFPTKSIINLSKGLFLLFATFSGTFHKTKEEIEREISQIRKAQEDPKEFAPIYNKYYKEIFIYISKRVDDLDLVSDITSKTFTNCLINLHRFKYMGVPFSAWLYKIAVNEVRLFFRAKKNYPRTICITDTDLSDFTNETIDESNYELAQELIPKLLGNLSEKELQCIELRFFEKKSFKEIGFMMGLSEVNAKVRTYRILKKLKEIASNL
jgi:RNA polymerase sigma-70 factor (ECF subfamily)